MDDPALSERGIDFASTAISPEFLAKPESRC